MRDITTQMRALNPSGQVPIDAEVDSLEIGGTNAAPTTRTHIIPLANLRKDSALKDALADTPGTSLLGLGDALGQVLTGTQTNNTSATENAGIVWPIPADYEAGEDLVINVRSKVSATRAVSATVDVVAKLISEDGAAGSDICATAAIALTTSYADKLFTITGTTLTPGALLSLVFTLATDDTGGSTNGTPTASKIAIAVPSVI